MILDRLLVLTVSISIVGGVAIIALLLLFLRISASEARIAEHIDATAARLLRKVLGRISDLDIEPAGDGTPPPPRSVRRR